jgi:type I restriction enzyme R subunit
MTSSGSTLYVDKNLKQHGLIQAFSRTNRVLNGTKPYGNILDFRQQQANVDAAIALFSGEKTGEQAREIWLVDKAPVVIEKLDAAVTRLSDFMQSQGLPCTPEAVHQLKGDAAKAAFIKTFKDVQRLKTQLDQYTDLTEDNAAAIENILPTRKAARLSRRLPGDRPAPQTSAGAARRGRRRRQGGSGST